MRTTMIHRGRVARWVACALTTLACLCVGGIPAQADEIPVPIASTTPAPPAEGTLLPGKKVFIFVELSDWNIPGDSSLASFHKLQVTFSSDPFKADLTRDECQLIADTFWTGSSPDVDARATLSEGDCKLVALYYDESRHFFFSVDESGHFQMRAPMKYLHQIVTSFGDAEIVRLELHAAPIRNAKCNAAPSDTAIDSPVNAETHTTMCSWSTNFGATIPTTDDPLVEGDIEDYFFSKKMGTAGPFVDMPFPINPFAPAPIPAPTTSPTATPTPSASTVSESASPSSDVSTLSVAPSDELDFWARLSTSLLIGLGAALVLLFVSAVAVVVALRRTD